MDRGRETREKLLVRADDELVDRRRLEVGADLVGCARRAGIGRVDVVEAGETAEIHFAGIHMVVPVRVRPVVIEALRRGEGAREADPVEKEVREPGVGGAQKRPPILTERVGRAHARLPPPGRDRIALVARVMDRRKEVRVIRVGGNGRGLVSRPTIVVADARADRQAVGRQRVAHEDAEPLILRRPDRRRG